MSNNAAPALFPGGFTGNSLLRTVQPDCRAMDSFGLHIQQYKGQRG